jgi:hypothetical protein
MCLLSNSDQTANNPPHESVLRPTRGRNIPRSFARIYEEGVNATKFLSFATAEASFSL